MDTNTPATPSTPDGDYLQDRVDAARASADKARPDPVAAGKAGTPARPKGPNASAIVVGLAALVFAGMIIARETLDWRIDWARIGPGAIVAIGAVMVAIGAIGLIRRHDDA
jgi:hypothetical protein